MYRVLDLFGGIGGFHLGLADIGKVVLACEINPSARLTYTANFPDTPMWGDVRTLVDPPEHDILCAGFPCQSFSLAAGGINIYGGDYQYRKGLLDPRGTLFYEIVRILRARQPRAFILENVMGLVTHEGGRTMATILGELEGAGYVVDWSEVSAAPWVPQARRRIIIRGVRGSGLDEMFALKAIRIETPPKPWPVLRDILHEFVDPEFAPDPRSGSVLMPDTQYDLTDKQEAYTHRSCQSGGDRSRILHDPERAARTLLTESPAWGGRTGILVGDGPNRTGHWLMEDRANDITARQERSIRKAYRISNRDDGDILSALDMPTKTLLTHAPARAGRHAVVVGDASGRIRRITPREAARLMGFPEGFILPQSDWRSYDHLGNAVVPAVVAAVARALVPLLV